MAVLLPWCVSALLTVQVLKADALVPSVLQVRPPAVHPACPLAL